jgi:hypothetical protein
MAGPGVVCTLRSTAERASTMGSFSGTAKPALHVYEPKSITATGSSAMACAISRVAFAPSEATEQSRQNKLCVLARAMRASRSGAGDPHVPRSRPQWCSTAADARREAFDDSAGSGAQRGEEADVAEAA